MLARLCHLLTFMAMANSKEDNRIYSSPNLPNFNSQGKYHCKPWPSNKYWRQLQFGRKCYTWDEARELCSQDGGRMMQIPSSDMYAAITNSWNLAHVGICFWIGATDRVYEGNWKWTDGSKVSYNHWEFSIFHFLNRWTMHCAGMCHKLFDSGSWYWKEFECRDTLRFLCEYDAQYVPVVEKEIPDPTPSTGQNTPKSLMFMRLPRGTSTGLLYNPDMVTTAPLYTICARKCLERGTECTVFKYNSVTKECVGFFLERF